VIEPAERPATRRPGRIGRVARALSFGLTDTEAAPVALAGFLLRGGILLLALPGVVLPSVIGIAGATGVDAISIDGRPTAWLLALIAVVVAATFVWLAIASLVGSLVDVWLIRMASEPRPERAHRRLELPPGSLLMQLAAIRMTCLLPLAAALAWAASRIFNATYAELTTPTNLTSPLPLRVVLAAGDAVAVVAAVWLVTETIAAIAIRREVLAGRGFWRSIGGAAAQIVRRPISTAVTVAVSYAVSAAAIGLAMVVTSMAFDWCRIAARNQDPIAIKLGIGDFATVRDFRPVAFSLAAFAFALAWAAALALAALTSAWRSAAFTNEVTDSLAAERESAVEPNLSELGLSGTTAERSGD